MDHNNFKFQEDLIIPFKAFFKENKIRLHHVEPETKRLEMPKELFKIPKSIKEYNLKVKKIQDKQSYSALDSHQKPAIKL